MQSFSFLLTCLILVLTTAFGCSKKKPEPVAKQQGQVVQAPVEPLQPLPELGPLDDKKVSLGQRLYHDTVLSGDGTLACVTCHDFSVGGAEHKKTSTGIGGQIGPINSPTVFNSALNFVQFWDGRAADLESQAGGPVTNPLEMGATWEGVLSKLNKDAKYVTAFKAAYSDGVTQKNLQNALAEYEKTLLTPSRFDAYLKGDQNALTTQEKAGYALFKSTGCTACHMGPNVGGTMYQKFGLVRDYFKDQKRELTHADNGRFNVTKNEADRHFFKVPTLRNVALTSPYFHDGSVEKLEDAVVIMARYQLAKELQPQEVTDMVAFLNSLTGIKLPEPPLAMASR